MSRATRYPAEVRERAVRLVFEHEREYDSLDSSWFNHRRLLEPIDNIPPAELEEEYQRQAGRGRKRA